MKHTTRQLYSVQLNTRYNLTQYTTDYYITLLGTWNIKGNLLQKIKTSTFEKHTHKEWFGVSATYIQRMMDITLPIWNLVVRNKALSVSAETR